MKKIFLILSVLVSLNAFTEPKEEYKKQFDKHSRGDVGTDNLVYCVATNRGAIADVSRCVNYILAMGYGYRLMSISFPQQGVTTAFMTKD